jgi:hypothetical protein
MKMSPWMPVLGDGKIASNEYSFAARPVDVPGGRFGDCQRRGLLRSQVISHLLSGLPAPDGAKAWMASAQNAVWRGDPTRLEAHIQRLLIYHKEGFDLFPPRNGVSPLVLRRQAGELSRHTVGY